MNSRLNVLSKRFKMKYTCLKLRRGRDRTIFVAFLCVTISCFKCYLASFSRCKTAFSPNIIPHKHAEQDQIDAKWLERVGRSLTGPRQANLVLIAYASSEGSGDPAHPRSLARTSAARSYKQ